MWVDSNKIADDSPLKSPPRGSSPRLKTPSTTMASPEPDYCPEKPPSDTTQFPISTHPVVQTHDGESDIVNHHIPSDNLLLATSQLPDLPQAPPDFLLPSNSFPNDNCTSDNDNDRLEGPEQFEPEQRPHSNRLEAFEGTQQSSSAIGQEKTEASAPQGMSQEIHEEKNLESASKERDVTSYTSAQPEETINEFRHTDDEEGTKDGPLMTDQISGAAVSDIALGQSEEGLIQSQEATGKNGSAPFPSFGGFAWATASSLISAASNIKKEPRLMNLGARLTEMIQPGEEETAEVEPLSKEADRQLQTIDRLATQIIAAEENLAASRENEDRMRLDCQRLRAELKARDAECLNLRARVSEAADTARQAIRDELQKELESLIAERDQKIRGLQNDLLQTSNSVFSLQDQCGRLTESESELCESLRKSEAEKQNLAIQVESLQSELMRRRDASDNLDTRSALNVQLLQEQVESLEKQLKMARQETEQLSNHVKAGDLENRQMSSTLASMKERFKALEMLKQRVLSSPDSQITQAQRDCLAQCATADDVLLLLRTTHQEMEMYKERLTGAAQTLDTLTNRLQQTKSALQESQAETDRLRSLKLPSSVKADSVSSNVEIGQADEKMQQSVAALEARLHARTERVQSLVAELASAKAQLSALEGGKAQVQVFLDDGRRSWCNKLFLVPLVVLSTRVLGKKPARALGKVLSKQASAIMQIPFVATTDFYLRQTLRLITGSRDGPLIIGGYLVILHTILLCTLFLT